MIHSTTRHATVPQEAFRLAPGYARKPDVCPFPVSIERIGADAVEDENMGLVHPARVRLLNAHITMDCVRRALAPSLAATAEIKTGHRRIVEFLLSPLSPRVQEAGKER